MTFYLNNHSGATEFSCQVTREFVDKGLETCQNKIKKDVGMSTQNSRIIGSLLLYLRGGIHSGQRSCRKNGDFMCH